MTDDIRKRLSQLVEINRALAHDLDMSRRIIAELGNERDSLIARIESLEVEIADAAHRETEDKSRSDSVDLQCELIEERQKLREMNRQWTHTLKETEAAAQRANLAEERLYSLTTLLRETEEERDSYKVQIDEMTEAMDEIKYNLANLCYAPPAVSNPWLR